MAIESISPLSRLTWLHLSDFHLRTKTGWEQDIVLETMLRDIRSRFGQQQRPDLIFMTGDIAFAGKEEEYKLAEEFIRKLCAETQLPEGRIFLVPGNHDIDIDLEEDAAHGARQGLKTANDVARFLGHEGRRKTLFARQKAFRDFANRVSLPADPIYSASSFSHTRTVQIGPIRVRVLLLDSSWLAGGGTGDAAALSVGERQVIECGKGSGDFLTFALMHHPFSWLKEFEQVAIENRVSSYANICLRGHVHSPDHRAIESSQGRLITFTAGAGFETRTSNNSYVWCSLDLATGSGESVVHRLNYAENRWIANEAQAWKLVSEPSVPSDLDSVRTAIISARFRYSSYVTCLIGAVKAEVPYLQPGQRVIFISVGVKVGAATNQCGELISRLRHHFHWKTVWEETLWEQHLASMAGDLNALFDQVDAADPDALSGHDRTCASLLPATNEIGHVSSPVCDEVRVRIKAEDFLGARAVLQRWKGQGVLRADEERELRRLEVFLLLGEGEAGQANRLALDLMQDPNLEPTDVALAARCAFSAKDVPRAAQLMRQALDFGVDIESVKTLGLRIAGAAGDGALTARLMGRT